MTELIKSLQAQIEALAKQFNKRHQLSSPARIDVMLCTRADIEAFGLEVASLASPVLAEDSKDVYAEGLDVGMKLGRQLSGSLMTKEELELIESLLNNFLGYDVTEDLMLTEDVKKALEAVKRELDKRA
jgi:hypothetical protein